MIAITAALLAQTTPTTSRLGTPAAPASSPGGYVFFAISAVIVGVALILYFQNRRPRTARENPAPNGADARSRGVHPDDDEPDGPADRDGDAP